MNTLRKWLENEIDKKDKSLKGTLHGNNKEVIASIEGCLWAFELCLEVVNKIHTTRRIK